jgi:hypothetical protein
MPQCDTTNEFPHSLSLLKFNRGELLEKKQCLFSVQQFRSQYFFLLCLTLEKLTTLVRSRIWSTPGPAFALVDLRNDVNEISQCCHQKDKRHRYSSLKRAFRHIGDSENTQLCLCPPGGCLTVAEVNNDKGENNSSEGKWNQSEV